MRRGKADRQLASLAASAASPVSSAGTRPIPRYTKPGDDGMNQTERRYSEYLEQQRLAGTIHAWSFQPEKFRLADIGKTCFYTPDFRVLLNDGTVRFDEVKGFMQEDAAIKIKWFVQQHPYPIQIVRWVKKSWQIELVTP